MRSNRCENSMRENTDWLSLLLYFAVIGLFVAAVVVGFASQSSEYVVGMMLLTVGAGAVTFARRLTVAQRLLAEKPFVPGHWKKVRPLTFILWGAGAMLVGVLQFWH